jgi:uncharacterized membrane protein
MNEVSTWGMDLRAMLPEAKPAWTFVRERRYLALRTGVAAAAASVAPSFARGLLPRSTTDQAIVTGASAAYWLGFASFGVSAVESVAELIVKARRTGDPEATALLAATVVAAVGVGVSRAIPDTHDVPMPLAITEAVARTVGGGAVATVLVIGSDKLMQETIGDRGLPTNLAMAAALGGGASVVRAGLRARRARIHGEAGHRASFVADKDPKKLVRSVATGAGVGLGLVAVAAAQFAVAEGSTTLVSRALGRSDDPVTPLVGHAAAAAGLGAIAAVALNRVTKRVMRADDIVEPAYPAAPMSPHVTSGPNSRVSFDHIGKEGRRFVVMTLTPEEITAVMGEPAVAPVRAIAGFGSARTPEDRARIAVEELEQLGAFERSTLVVAAPTGVGYVNYSFAEAVEYLTRGDCAIVVPQYALVPSALALGQTDQGVVQQRLILEDLRDRIARMPAELRPRLFQFGESLGAQVALDVAAEGTGAFEELGLDGGLYLGTPFRSALWRRWFADRAATDPTGILASVSEAGEIADLPESVRHVQVIHDDDPINKFAYSAVIRVPWWLGPPETRPPGVPRETKFRPVISFIISLIDLKNGMNSRPGEFVRVGHDYRIELCEAVQRTYRLAATEEQAERIEAALRDREREWATRRMIASRFAKARDSVLSQLSRWGAPTDSLGLDEQTVAALARGETGAPLPVSPVAIPTA